MRLASLFPVGRRCPRAYRPLLLVEPLEERALLDGAFGPGFDEINQGGNGGSGSGSDGQAVVDTRYVERLYNDLLHRAPARAELNAWIPILNTGLRRDQIAGQFTGSPEYRAGLIRSDYRAYLGREPETAALTGWLAQMNAGMNERQVTAHILASEEFFQGHGSSSTTWLQSVYGLALGRPAEQAGLQAWLGHLRAGASRYTVALGIVSSPEAQVWVVGDGYRGLLRRDVEAAGLTGWVKYLSGGATPAQFAQQLAASDEYFVGNYPPQHPAAASLWVTAVGGSQGAIVSDQYTNVTPQWVAGSGVAGRSFVLYVDGAAVARGRADTSGYWRINLPVSLADGPHSITARPLAGTGQFFSGNSFYFILDRVAPTVALEAPRHTNAAAPTIKLRVGFPDNLALQSRYYIDFDSNFDGDFNDSGERGVFRGTVRAGTNMVRLGTLPSGFYQLRARVEDWAGNTARSDAVQMLVNADFGLWGNPLGTSYGQEGQEEYEESEAEIPAPDSDGDGPGGSGGGSGGSSGGGSGGGGILVGGGGNGQGGGGSGIWSGPGVGQGGRQVPPNVNASMTPAENESEVDIAKDPSNPRRLFMVSNQTFQPGLFASYSTDGGATWTPRTIAGGSGGLPEACCDGHVAFDSFGNLFLVYLNANFDGIVVALSTDGGQSFTLLETIAGQDYPSIAVGAGTVWISFNDGDIKAAGARVTGLGQVSSFSTPQAVPNSDGQNFGDIAIGPNGQVVVSFQTSGSQEGPDQVRVSTDPDGLGPAGFTNPIVATNTNVGGFDAIPAQPDRTVFATSYLDYDVSGRQFNGRLYLVYVDENPDESDDTNIYLRFSDDDGATWSSRLRINDDTGTNSQFFPAFAVDQTTGAIAVAWYDARLDIGSGPGDTDGQPNTDVIFFGAVSFDGGASFRPNVQIASGPSNQAANTAFPEFDFGDYTGLDYHAGVFHPAWADNSLTLPGNTDAPNSFDIATAAVGAVPFVFLPDDRFELNDTSDRATNFGLLPRGDALVEDLTVGRHSNFLPDYDWYRWTAPASGVVTFNVIYEAPIGGDLHVRLFTLAPNNTMIQLASSTLVGLTTSQAVSAFVPAGAPVLLWVYGFDYAQANYDFTIRFV